MGETFWDLTTDSKLHNDIQCVFDCGSDLFCTMSKCGKNAVPCVMDKDSTCHKALFCMKDSHQDCSINSLQCILGLDASGVCSKSLHCLKEIGSMRCFPGMSQSTHELTAFLRCTHMHCGGAALKALVSV